MHKVGILCKESKMDKSLTQATVQSGILTHRLGQSDLPQLGGGMCFRAGSCGFQVWTAHVSVFAYEGYGRRVHIVRLVPATNTPPPRQI